MKVIEGGFGKKQDNTLASDLRALADAVDAGEVTDFAAAYVRSDNYETMYNGSLIDALVLATLLHRRVVDGFVL